MTKPTKDVRDESEKAQAVRQKQQARTPQKPTHTVDSPEKPSQTGKPLYDHRIRPELNASPGTALGLHCGAACPRVRPYDLEWKCGGTCEPALA